MSQSKPSDRSLSSSRSRRSNVNLSDLRLSPLSTKFTQPSKEAVPSTSDETHDSSFRRSHPSYLQGKSAPTTPGILSRSSSRKHLGGGLSRRGSLYDDNVSADIGGFDYAGVVRGDDVSARVAVGSGQIPKAKSEAALLVQRSKLAGKGPQPKRPNHAQGRSRTGGTNTPRAKSKIKDVNDDWLTRTGAATNALLQENKGQSWIASRESSTSLLHLQDTTDDEDEGYEELAAQSASGSRHSLVDDESRRPSRWGSRYGSRTASRRTSRRGSVSLTTGSRTPIVSPMGLDGNADYFDMSMRMAPDFVDGNDEESDSQDDAALDRLAQTRSFGVGGIIDRIMNFSLFNVEEREEATEDEDDRGAGETEEQARERREAETTRKREEKEKLQSRGTASEGEDRGEEAGEGGGAWSDAAWLLSVASKAMF